MASGATERFKKPAIYITDADYEVLSLLANAAVGDAPAAELLGEEVERAIRVTPDFDEPFVKLGSYVVFKDLSTERLKEVQLTLPQHADINAARVSVLTPVGASLLGLMMGSRFQWIGADGRVRELEVLAIQDPRMVT